MSCATSVHTVYDQTLAMLSGLLGKAAAHDKGDALLSAKLADDMFPLSTQVRYAGHLVPSTLNQLAGGDYTPAESDPETIAEAQTRIADLSTMLAAHLTDGWTKSDTRIEFGPGNGFNFAAEAHEYVRDWAMPNFYFHVNAAYAILRSEGLDIGKADYLPFMMKYLVPPTE